jgi:hypothetical protein
MGSLGACLRLFSVVELDHGKEVKVRNASFLSLKNINFSTCSHEALTAEYRPVLVPWNLLASLDSCPS